MTIQMSGLRFVLATLGVLLLFQSVSVAALDAKNPKILQIAPLQPMPVEVYDGDSIQLRYSVVNPSEHSVTITSIFPRKGSGSGVATPSILAPGGKGSIVLDYSFPEAIGRGQVNFLVKYQDPSLPTQLLEVPFFVQTAYEPELMAMDFGDVHPGQSLRSTLEVTSRLVPDLNFAKVVSKPDWLDVSFSSVEGGSPQSQNVVGTLSAMPPFGLNVGKILLESNVAEDKDLEIPVVVRAFSKYSASPFPVTMGAVPEGQDRTTTLRINRIAGGEVQIRRVETGSPALAARIEPCGDGCADLIVTFDSMKARRGLRTFITVQFIDDEVDLKIPIDGFVVPIGVKMDDLGDLDEITVKSRTVELEQHE